MSLLFSILFPRFIQIYRFERKVKISLITLQPLKKARSSIGADCGSGLTRPLLSDWWNSQPPAARRQWCVEWEVVIRGCEWIDLRVNCLVVLYCSFFFLSQLLTDDFCSPFQTNGTGVSRFIRTTKKQACRITPQRKRCVYTVLKTLQINSNVGLKGFGQSLTACVCAFLLFFLFFKLSATFFFLFQINGVCACAWVLNHHGDNRKRKYSLLGRRKYSYPTLGRQWRWGPWRRRRIRHALLQTRHSRLCDF